VVSLTASLSSTVTKFVSVFGIQISWIRARPKLLTLLYAIDPDPIMSSSKIPVEFKPPIICWQQPEADSDSARRGAELMLPASNTVDDARKWILSADELGLFLKSPDELVLRSGFGRDNARLRAAQSNFIQNTFAKAIGVARLQKALSRAPKIIDATGGLGQDAMTLASLGCDVTVIERHPVLHCLLVDMLHENDQGNAVLDDASRCLNSVATNISADVIYLDPMYPEQRRRGKSKKGMQILHELLGPDVHNDTLLASALEACQTCEGYRVVVKRPKNAPTLNGSDNWSGQLTTIESSSTRYDIYHCRSINDK